MNHSISSVEAERLNVSIKRNNRKVYSRRVLKENVELYLIMLPVFIHIFIFSYIPMYGIVITFQNYYPEGT